MSQVHHVGSLGMRKSFTAQKVMMLASALRFFSSLHEQG